MIRKFYYSLNLADFFGGRNLASFNIIGRFVTEIEDVVGRDVLLSDFIKIQFSLFILWGENAF